jgi:hypothetical protein
MAQNEDLSRQLVHSASRVGKAVVEIYKES